MADYVIKSFRGGISDEDDKGIAGSFKYGYSIDIHKRKDSLSAKQTMATILASGSTGTTLTAPFNVFVPASDGTTYAFGATGSVFAQSGDGTWTFVYNDENGEIRGAAEWEHDDGVNYLYWATATSLARKRLIGADTTPDTALPSLVREARWTDVVANYKTDLNNVKYHTMQNASGQLAIANGESLASVEFDGDYTSADLNIRPGNLIKALEERDDFTILGSFREDGSEEGHIWSWLTTATNYIQKKKIPIKGVNALISTELMLLQGGSNGELFFSDFTNTVPLLANPGGGEVNPNGVSIDNDLAVFGFFNSDYPGIWGYGRRARNRNMAFSQEYRLAPTIAGSTVSTIGAIAMINNTLLASWGTSETDSSVYGVDSVSSTTKAFAVYEGLEFDAGEPQLKKYFDTVKLTMIPLPSGTSVAVKFRLDHASTGGDSSAGAGFKYAITGGSATSFAVADATEAEFRISEDAQIIEIGVELTPSENLTPEIISISTSVDPEQKHG